MIGQILYCITLLTIAMLCCMLTSRSVREGIIYGLFFAANYLLRVVFFLVNEAVGLIEPKLAGNTALYIYDQFVQNQSLLWQAGMDKSFYLQAVINAFGLFVYDYGRATLLFTNAWIGALTGLVVVIMLRRMCSLRSSLLLGALFVVYPAAFQFSIHGLRDIIIYLFATVYYLSWAFVMLKRHSWFDVCAIVVSCFGLISMRPEMLPFLALFPALHFVQRGAAWWSRIGLPMTRLVVLCVSVCCVCGAMLAAGWMLYEKVMISIGVEGVISPVEILSTQAEARFSRVENDEFGAGSHIMSGGVFRALPLPLRFLMQVMGLIVIPYPWLMNSGARLLAAFDSLFVIGALWYVGTRLWGLQLRTMCHRVSMYLLLTFSASIVIMGTIIINQGNGYRMRLVFMPLVFIAIALLTYQREQNAET